MPHVVPPYLRPDELEQLVGSAEKMRAKLESLPRELEQRLDREVDHRKADAAQQVERIRRESAQQAEALAAKLHQLAEGADQVFRAFYSADASGAVTAEFPGEFAAERLMRETVVTRRLERATVDELSAYARLAAGKQDFALANAIRAELRGRTLEPADLGAITAPLAQLGEPPERQRARLAAGRLSDLSHAARTAARDLSAPNRPGRGNELLERHFERNRFAERQAPTAKAYTETAPPAYHQAEGDPDAA